MLEQTAKIKIKLPEQLNPTIQGTVIFGCCIHHFSHRRFDDLVSIEVNSRLLIFTWLIKKREKRNKGGEIKKEKEIRE